MSQPDYDIVVVGAGLVGLAFACAMKDSGLRILVIEAGEFPKRDASVFDIRVNSIHLGSQAFLGSMGVWGSIAEKRMSPFHEIRVWDSGGSRIEFHAHNIGEDQLGHIVENNVLTTSLMEHIEQAENIEVMIGARLETLEDVSEKVRLTIQGNEQISSYLVVGADGGNSMVRQMAGIGIAKQKGYGQRAIVAQVEALEPTHGIAYQKFLPTGPLAFLPLSDGSFSIVWSYSVDRAEELEKMEEHEFEQRLARDFDYQLGDIRLVSRRVSFELRKLQAASYFNGRTVLIGDSAHVIHPLAGMGANLGLMDAAALSEVLCESAFKNGDLWSRQKLRKYERWRKSANSFVMNLMDGFDSGFRSPSQIMQTVLGLGVSMTNHAEFAKRQITRFACGVAGDIPEIARRA